MINMLEISQVEQKLDILSYIYTCVKRTLYLTGYPELRSPEILHWLSEIWLLAIKTDSVKDSFMNPLCYQTLLSFGESYTSIIKHWLICPTTWNLIKSYYNCFFLKLMRERERQTETKGRRERILHAWHGKYCKVVPNCLYWSIQNL